MEEKVITIINQIRLNKGLEPFSSLKPEDNLRRDIGFTSFDLAELTVRIENEFNIDIFENGLVNTLGEIFIKLR
jgi:acyl carrier protein